MQASRSEAEETKVYLIGNGRAGQGKVVKSHVRKMKNKSQVSTYLPTHPDAHSSEMQYAHAT